MKYSIYYYRDYKQYLKELLNSLPKKGRGMRAQLAQAADCQTTYISQVLSGSAHFNLEQADRISDYFAHNVSENRYFLLLVQFGRAGTTSLRRKLREQIQEIQERQMDLKTHFNLDNPLGDKEQMQYYSNWLYSAIHVMLSIPQYQSRDILAEKLNIEMSFLNDVLNFLVNNGFAEKEGAKYKIGQQRIHLESDSPLIQLHHTNWRLQALKAISHNNKNNLHYSSVVTISKKDAAKLRQQIVRFLDESKKTIAASPEEVPYSLNLDFFGV
jgi:uncharacterized protein (TIGR02147 family)